MYVQTTVVVVPDSSPRQLLVGVRLRRCHGAGGKLHAVPAARVYHAIFDTRHRPHHGLCVADRETRTIIGS
jgi:hypothetical protein